MNLHGKRIVVLGASAGIGRAFADRAIDEGARVVVSGRRLDRLQELVAGHRGRAVAADLSKPSDCERLAAAVQESLEEVDLLLCTVGHSPLRRFVDVTADDWYAVLGINVVGIHQALRACLPLFASGAIAAVLSSEAVDQARVGLGAYTASKAALESTLAAWRAEHPNVRFSCVPVGTTFPTEFSRDFDPNLLVDLMQEWAHQGFVQTDMMRTEDVASVLAGVFATALHYPSIGIENLVLRSPSPVAVSSGHLEELAVGNIDESDD